MKITLSADETQQLRNYSGLRIAKYEFEKLNAWVEQRLETLDLKNIQEYLRLLSSTENSSVERTKLSRLLTTGETFFMRDAAQMNLIKETLIPKILEKNKVNKTITFWAPACATGEEVYSLIILLNQCLEINNNWTIDIIGSDINEDFLVKARAGVYTKWSFRECASDFKEKYFTPCSGGWKINDDIRAQARFINIDLVQAELPNQKFKILECDLIMCRNLFIYMHTEAINAVTDKLFSCLKEGGVLITAHGEIHAFHHQLFNVCVYPGSIVYTKNAVKHTESLLRIHPAKDEYFNSAWHLANNGCYLEALEICKDLYLSKMMRPDLHYLHAIILLELKDIDGAKVELRKALYIDKNFIPAYLELISINMDENKSNAALKICNQALSVMHLPSHSLLSLNSKSYRHIDIKTHLNVLRHQLIASIDKSLNSQTTIFSP